MNSHGGGLYLHKDVEFMNTVKNQKFMVQIGVCDGLTLASALILDTPGLVHWRI